MALKASYLVTCPFYKMNDRERIFCEGALDSSPLNIRFGGGAGVHLDGFCVDNWKNCPVARMLWAKYEDVSGMQVFTKGFLTSSQASKLGAECKA